MPRLLRSPPASELLISRLFNSSPRKKWSQRVLETAVLESTGQDKFEHQTARTEEHRRGVGFTPAEYGCQHNFDPAHTPSHWGREIWHLGFGIFIRRILQHFRLWPAFGGDSVRIALPRDKGLRAACALREYNFVSVRLCGAPAVIVDGYLFLVHSIHIPRF